MYHYIQTVARCEMCQFVYWSVTDLLRGERLPEAVADKIDAVCSNMPEVARKVVGVLVIVLNQDLSMVNITQALIYYDTIDIDSNVNLNAVEDETHRYINNSFVFHCFY